ncbi:S-layer homology domain-containing protein [Lysinibacillus sphaericus]|nr:S-layer homology domain-containing protein [Bacillus thuringiensis]QPA52167.1 S-layer homology domain-containing protein [Lysinibacillus sphaericus]QPA56668.1 S-layer homology domain-containing protein [Lysinibacillus sphaericus]QTB20348.1 S-layer homology domain-containing protein [Lysinibacillus sphaericus]
MKALAASVMTAAMVIPVATENVQAAPVTKTTFKDVAKSHWAYESIKQVAEKGLVTGYEDGTYKPSAQVTRAEFATFLSRVFDGNNRTPSKFSDVGASHWANDAIQEGLAVGFIKASDFSNNKFEPNKAMTRGEMSRWLANGLAHANADYGKAIEEMANSSLTIIPIPEFYGGGVNKKDIPYIGVALGTGLLSGYEDFSFKPNGNTTRAEVATILIRFMDAMKKAPSDFTGLKELREVASTGTNILTISNLKKSEYGYEDVLGKSHTYLNNTGVSTIEHAIFVDVTGSKSKGIFKDMFFDESNNIAFLNKGMYTIYYEYTFKPSRNVSFVGIKNGSDMNFASNLVVDKSKVEQFHLSSPTGSSKNEFLKGETYRYWAFNGLLAKPGVKLRGRTDDGSMFSYEVPK